MTGAGTPIFWVKKAANASALACSAGSGVRSFWLAPATAPRRIPTARSTARRWAAVSPSQARAASCRASVPSYGVPGREAGRFAPGMEP